MSVSIAVGATAGSVPLSYFGELSGVRVSWRAIGGDFELTCTVTGANLAARAAAWLYATVRHDTWGWFGRIVTVDVSSGWLKTRYDLIDKYANEIAAVYDTGIYKWSSDTVEINKYGKWEAVIENSQADATQAQDWADRTLTKRAATVPYVVGMNSEYAESDRVEIRALGLLPLAARRANNYVNGSDRIGIDVSALANQYIHTIITDLCDTWSHGELSALAIDASDVTTTITQEELIAKNTWGLLEELATWHDETTFRLDCDASGRVRYYVAPDSADDTTYDIYKNSIRRRGGGAALEPGNCRPGWYRDVATGRAIYALEVVAYDGATVPELRRPDVIADAFLDIAPGALTPVPSGDSAESGTPGKPRTTPVG